MDAEGCISAFCTAAFASAVFSLLSVWLVKIVPSFARRDPGILLPYGMHSVSPALPFPPVPERFFLSLRCATKLRSSTVKRRG